MRGFVKLGYDSLPKASTGANLTIIPLWAFHGIVFIAHTSLASLDRDWEREARTNWNRATTLSLPSFRFGEL